tara:strand:+ start:190 stop:525 length:336 start_codon:yes stop_codon:yes gene_type:complete
MTGGDWKKTYWEDENGNRATIQEILFALKDEPALLIDVADVKRLRRNVVVEQHRVDAADMSYPIIVVELDGDFQYILDGHHRLQKAIDEKRDCILGKVFRGEVTNTKENKE